MELSQTLDKEGYIVRCSTCQTDFSHVYTAEDLTGLVNEVITAIF